MDLVSNKQAGEHEPFAPIVGDIDKLIHEPARLKIMSYLFVVESADFRFLRGQTELTWGNLSAHISKLEAGGYVRVKKEFVKKKPVSIAELTVQGRSAFTQYRQQMREIWK